MQVTGALTGFLAGLLVFVSPFLASCAAPMNRTPDPGKPLAADEGIVIGSVLVRIGVAQDVPAPPVASLFLVPARSLHYSLESGPQRNTRSIVEKPIAGELRRSLRIEPGREEVFVTRMAAGPHVFFRLAPQGYEDAAAELGIRFTVMPGTTTYIGRVILDLPEKLPLGSGLPKGLYSLKPGILIEDAEQATLDSIRNSGGSIVGNVATDLMRAN